MASFREFIERHFDKLLLGAIVVWLIHVVIFLAIYVNNPETLSWARELTSGFAGALVGLITGIRMGQQMSQESGKNKSTTTVQTENPPSTPQEAKPTESVE